jgi:glycosyltransferase involved in cell wall biosynthesis
MNVLQVYKYYHPFIGGIENHVRALATALSKHVEVRVLVANTRPRREIDLVDGIPVARVPRYGQALSTPLAPTFPLWLRRQAADITHIHLANPLATFSYDLIPPNGTRLVASYHMDTEAKNALAHRLYQPFLHRFLQRAEAILVASPTMLERCATLQPHRGKCVLVPYGIDVERFAPTPDLERQARELRSRYGSPLVLFVGRLVYYKGVDTLIRAAERIQGTVLVIGTGPQEEMLRRLASSLQLSKKVRFLGHLPDEDLPAYYHACDVFVLPSTAPTEAFGLVQVEAMACGKPVVCTDLPTGVTYVNRHGETGLVVPPRDPQALAEAVNRLLADPALRQRLGRQGRERVEREFTKEAMVQKILGVYEKVLGR